MATGPKYVVHFRRSREGKTDYRKRLKLLKARVPRAVIRKSLKHIVLQIVEYAPEGDRVIASTHSSELKKMGWTSSLNNTSASYLCGLMLAKRARNKKVTKVIADLGLYPTVKGSKLFAAVKGLVDGGIKVPFDESIAPGNDRITGKHINQEVVKQFDSIKNKILES